MGVRMLSGSVEVWLGGCNGVDGRGELCTLPMVWDIVVLDAPFGRADGVKSP